jgi:zeaxanthin glucosyltransferase
MSRYLFVSLPLSGHVHPIAAVAAELRARGHEIAWAGSESFLRPHVADDRIVAIPLRVHRGQAERGMAATRSRWAGYIVPHAKVTLPGIRSAVAEFRPDVMLVDQHAIAAATVATEHSLAWASLGPTTMEFGRPYRQLPRVERWIGERMAQVWTMAGLPGVPPHDLRFSPHLVIAFTGEVLTGRIDGMHLVGPALTDRPVDDTFPWDWIDPRRRLVLVTMGTISMDLAEAFHVRILEALRPLRERVQAIVVAPDGTIRDPEPHLLVRSRVPVLALMPRLDAVVSHGGLNTVCEALAHRVPLVVAPIKGDQPINAAQVAAAGAGIRVSFDHARAPELRTAIEAVLDVPEFRAAAGRVGDALRAAGGARAAADLIEALRPSTETAGPLMKASLP